MYYIIRREGNYFNKKDFEKVCGEGSLQTALDNNDIASASGGNFKGINNRGYRQWRRIPDLYHRSGASRFLTPSNTGPIKIRRARELNIDISMAISSGYVIQNTTGLHYDTGKTRPVNREYTPFTYRHDVIGREGNELNIYTYNYLSEYIITSDFQYDSRSKLYKGLADDPLSKVITFEHDDLVGMPYIFLDQLYKGAMSRIDIRDFNNDEFETIAQMILSGHVFIRGNTITLDRQNIKEHNFYNWVGKRIYCRD